MSASSKSQSPYPPVRLAPPVGPVRAHRAGHRSPRWLAIVAALAVVGSALNGCGGEPDGEPEPGIANPASVHCEEQGGRLEIEEDAEGNQTGICVFPDGSSCEEWAFYRGECEPDAGAS
jgi:putative hemolysin